MRKALEMIKRIAEDAKKAAKKLKVADGGDDAPAAASDEDDDEDSDAAGGDIDRPALEKTVAKYQTLWEEFGKALKLGAMLLIALLAFLAC